MREPRPHEPTSAARPAPNGRGDAPPPRPPHELPAIVVGATQRTFETDGRRWTARLAGRGACGTGSYGLALVEAVQFFDPQQPDRPLREALIARGRFDTLFDAELAALLERAAPVVLPDER